MADRGITDFSDLSNSGLSSQDQLDLQSTFVHEFVHVWQFTQQWGGELLGLVQWGIKAATTQTYGYALTNNTNFSDLNMEQQAQVVQDHFLLANSQPVVSIAPEAYVTPALSVYQKAFDQVYLPPL
jgi:hypothetical protein